MAGRRVGLREMLGEEKRCCAGLAGSTVPSGCTLGLRTASGSRRETGKKERDGEIEAGGGRGGEEERDSRKEIGRNRNRETGRGREREGV